MANRTFARAVSIKKKKKKKKRKKGKSANSSSLHHHIIIIIAAIRDIKNEIPEIELYEWSDTASTQILEGAFDLNTEMSKIDPAPLMVQLDYVNPRDKLIYIYTSGTTGMPKAAVITNLR